MNKRELIGQTIDAVKIRKFYNHYLGRMDSEIVSITLSNGKVVAFYPAADDDLGHVKYAVSKKPS